MTEFDYIQAQDLTRLRIAREILRDTSTPEIPDEERKQVLTTLGRWIQALYEANKLDG